MPTVSCGWLWSAVDCAVFVSILQDLWEKYLPVYTVPCVGTLSKSIQWRVQRLSVASHLVGHTILSKRHCVQKGPTIRQPCLVTPAPYTIHLLTEIYYLHTWALLRARNVAIIGSVLTEFWDAGFFFLFFFPSPLLLVCMHTSDPFSPSLDYTTVLYVALHIHIIFTAVPSQYWLLCTYTCVCTPMFYLEMDDIDSCNQSLDLTFLRSSFCNSCQLN